MHNCITPKGQENAVSEVIGEILMLAITVIIFAILLASIGTIVSRSPTQIVHMDALAINDTTLAIRHTGGDTIDYGHLAVVINGNTGQYPGSDENGDGRWDLGEYLYISGLDTTQSMSIMVYDSTTNNVLGEFTLDTLPAGLPVILPSATPSVTPTPSATATPSATPSATATPSVTPTPQLHHLTITASNPWSDSTGTLTVTAYDQNDNVFTCYRGKVYFTSSNNHDRFQYYNNGHDYQFTAADNGVHVFHNTDLDFDRDTHTIKVQEHQGPWGTVDVYY